MLYEIKHWNGRVLVTQEADSLKSALELLVRNHAVLSGADLSGADLSDADLSDADLSDADLSDADLSGADLSGAVLSGAVLSGADLSDAVLSGAVLSGAVLSGADLSDAVLSDAVLSGADLSGKELLAVPMLHAKILEGIEAGGALEMGAWHGPKGACDTTHCRAGWAVHLAGTLGRYVEAQMGTAAAGALITLASCPWLEKVPNFYASNEAALADIKACAEREKAEAAQ